MLQEYSSIGYRGSNMLERHIASFQAEEIMFRTRSPSLSDSQEHGYHVFEMSTDTDTASLQDSVTRKRRHAIYFPKPPIWCVRPYPDDSASSGSSVPLPFMEGRQDGSSGLNESDDSFEDANMFHPRNSDHSSEETLPEPSSQASFRQVKPELCTRLQSYKDIRMEPGNNWAIQEGSLVICLDPSYIVHERPEQQLDEFEISNGDVYIICRLYADLWALCARASLTPISESPSDDDTISRQLGFIPLCAVTLAANYGAFMRRCARWMAFPDEPRCSENGRLVIPPERSHSLNASRQTFEGTYVDVALPHMDLGACQNIAPAQKDYVPLDSTLGQILCELGSRRDRLRRLRTRLQLQNLWSNLKSRSIFHQSKRTKFIGNKRFSFHIAAERLHILRSDRASSTKGELKELFSVHTHQRCAVHWRNLETINDLTATDTALK